MDVIKVLRELISRHNSYPAVKLVWECQLPIPPSQLPLMSPTHYIRELGMKTEDRLDLLCKQQKRLEFWEPGTDLSVVPSIIVFQNFKPTNSYSLSINIRNIGKRMQKVGILMESSSEFSLDEKSTRISKFAPGMVFKPSIYFTPQEDRDFFHKLVIVTKDARFAIPILGLGSRGILNPPDSIDFLKVPVKYLKTRMISMTNIGNRTARFLLTATGPFCVSPERGVVDSKQSFTMEVSFYSDKVTSAEGFLSIQYDNGEEVTVVLKAEAINDRICLENSQLSMKDTYIGLKGMAHVRIMNDTPIVAEFKWKKFANADAGEEALFFGELSKVDRFTRHYSINRGEDASLLMAEPSVICIDCTEPLVLNEEADPAFPPEDFLIEPVWGKVQPYSSTECVVIFSPYQAVHYIAQAYLDITGREDRLGLIMEGKCVNPKFTFGFDENFIPMALVSGHTNEVAGEPIT